MKKTILFIACFTFTIQAFSAAKTTTVCAGDSAKITLSNHIAGSTIQWQSSSDFSTWTSVVGQTQNIIKVLPVASIYYRALVSQGGNCPNFYSDTTYISSVAIPSAPTATNNSPICSGSSLVLTASTVSGATYNWTGPALYTSSSQSPTITAATSVNAGTYSVYATISGCKSVAGTTTVSQQNINSWATTAVLAVSNINSQTVGSYTFTSASKIAATWNPPTNYTVDHYVLTATESVFNTSVTKSVAASKFKDTITLLKSGTLYSVKVKACADASCSTYLDCSNAATATTSEEYWQIHGQPNTGSYDYAYRLHANVNVLSFALPQGSWAGASYKGKVRYYGTPMPKLGISGSIPALSKVVASASSRTSVSEFKLDSLTGLSYSKYATGNKMFPYIGQSVAIPYNNKIRLFFNATLDDGQRRLFYIDSKDGYIGKDFDASADSMCIDITEFTTGANCEYTMAMGTKFDAAFTQNTNLEHVMQFKIGYKMLDNEWIWKGDSAFMVSAIGLPLAPNNPCTPAFNKCAYASYNGTTWAYEYDGVCPKVFDGMRAPSIVHMGGDKYKIYFEHNTTLQAAPSDTLKPMKVMYAYGKNYPTYADWEGMALARDVNYLWPNGVKLTAKEESILDDYTFFAPIPANQDFQIQYANMTASTGPSFAGTTFLLNP